MREILYKLELSLYITTTVVIHEFLTADRETSLILFGFGSPYNILLFWFILFDYM